jgi:signal transduction histidine kinase
VLARIARTPGGPLDERYYDFSYICVFDANGSPYGVYDHAVDVTDRVLARRAVEESVRDLEEERDLRERFVAALSHDLRTPLSAARLSAELLVTKAGDPRQLETATQRLVTNMDRADAMIRDLLDASRIKARQPLPLEIEALDLHEITQATLDELATLHGDRFVLAPAPAIAGHWDKTAVRRILENLATNAVKYGTAGTPITVRIDATAHVAELHVHNEGSPIPDDEQPALFELFRRAPSASTSSQNGWGIGLSLVAGLARAHGGEVTVRSAPGEGTTFSVRLPLDARGVR